MSVPRYRPSQATPSLSRSKGIAIEGKNSELTARSVETKAGAMPRYGVQNYTKPETPSKSLLTRPVKVSSAIPETRLPAPEVVENLELKQALMLLQPGARKEYTQKALDILETHLRDGNRSLEIKDELYKAAELIFEGKIESDGNVAAASRLIYLAERLDGWRSPGRLAEFDKRKHELVGRIYAEVEKDKTMKMLFGESVDPITQAAYKSCESVFQVPMLSEAYFTSLNPSQSIDEMQSSIEWAFQSFFIYALPRDRTIYFNKINESIREGAITQDQLLLHFELLKHAIDLGFLKAEDPHALNDLLGLGETVKALFAAGNIEMALFALGSRLVPMDVKYFNIHHYKELLSIVEESLVLVLEKGDEESTVLLCDKLKHLSEMTHVVNLDRYTYGSHLTNFKDIEKLIDTKLKDNPKNENLIKAKLKILAAEIYFSTETGKQFEYANERQAADLNRFFDESNLKDPELLLKKLQWAVEEGIVFFSDVFEERAEDLLYGHGMEKAEPEMAAKFFAHAALRKVATPLTGLRRAIMEMRANAIDEETIKGYEKQFEERIDLQQTALSKETRERVQEVLNTADAQMKEGNLLGASINYLLLAKTNLSSTFDVFEIFSDNRKVKAQVVKLVTMLSRSDVEEDRLWGQQLKALFEKAVNK